MHIHATSRKSVFPFTFNSMITVNYFPSAAFWLLGLLFLDSGLCRLRLLRLLLFHHWLGHQWAIREVTSSGNPEVMSYVRIFFFFTAFTDAPFSEAFPNSGACSSTSKSIPYRAAQQTLYEGCDRYQWQVLTCTWPSWHLTRSMVTALLSLFSFSL